MLSSSPLWMAGIGDIQQPPSSCFTGALAAKKQTQARKLTDGGGAGSLDAAGKGRGGGERRRRSSARGEGDTAQHVGKAQQCPRIDSTSRHSRHRKEYAKGMI